VKETHERAKKREVSLEVMSALNEKLARMRAGMAEFMEGLIEGAHSQDTLHLEFMNVLNETTAPLHKKKDEALEASIDALKMEVLKLKEDNPTKPSSRPSLLCVNLASRMESFLINWCIRATNPSKKWTTFYIAWSNTLASLASKKSGKVITVKAFLTDNAMLCWRHMCDETETPIPSTCGIASSRNFRVTSSQVCSTRGT